jgi:predicted transcriptional regulator
MGKYIMTYSLEIQEKSEHIEVRVSGERIRGQEIEDALNMWKIVAKKCDETGISRVLVVSTVTGSLPIISAYEIATSTDKVNWNRKFRTAIVDLNEESRQINLFGETVVVNRGYFQVKVFDNQSEAVKWLLKS